MNLLRASANRLSATRLEALVRANAAPRCGARSKRTGKPCRAAAMPNGRCKVHGGKSTGPRTLEGLERPSGQGGSTATTLAKRRRNGRACGPQCLRSAICATQSKAAYVGEPPSNLGATWNSDQTPSGTSNENARCPLEFLSKGQSVPKGFRRSRSPQLIRTVNRLCRNVSAPRGVQRIGGQLA